MKDKNTANNFLVAIHVIVYDFTYDYPHHRSLTNQNRKSDAVNFDPPNNYIMSYASDPLFVKKFDSFFKDFSKLPKVRSNYVIFR